MKSIPPENNNGVEIHFIPLKEPTYDPEHETALHIRSALPRVWRVDANYY